MHGREDFQEKKTIPYWTYLFWAKIENSYNLYWRFRIQTIINMYVAFYSTDLLSDKHCLGSQLKCQLIRIK